MANKVLEVRFSSLLLHMKDFNELKVGNILPLDYKGAPIQASIKPSLKNALANIGCD